MPFCKKCNPGEYQTYYNQIHCDTCPNNYVSPRGASSISDCTPRQIQPCVTNSAICGEHGICIPETRNPYLYDCICEDGYVGEYW